ncbi:MAG: RNA polymerase sigma factor [Planctomycetota bacterium JB042]
MDDGFDALYRRAEAGDPEAVDALLSRFLPGLRAFVRLRSGRLVRTRESASDLAQSACREVLQNLDRFEHGGEAGFRYWLYTTALRKIQKRAEYWRAEKRAAAREVPLLPADEESDECLLDAYRSVATPSRHAMAREELARVEAAFDALSEGDREIIVLARVCGMSHAEIGERLKKSAGAARVQLHRALGRLADELEE